MVNQPNSDIHLVDETRTAVDWIQQGDQLLKESRLTEATASYEQAVQLKPDSAAFQYKLGHALLQQNELEKAEVCFRLAVELDDQFHWGHYGLAQVASRLEQWEKAEAEYRRVIELKPDFVKVEQELESVLEYLRKRNLADVADHLTEVESVLDHQKSVNDCSKNRFQDSVQNTIEHLAFKQLTQQSDYLAEKQKLGKAIKCQTSEVVKVSVIINTYNRAKYLSECLDSFKYQSYTNFEIIVINGPSTDNTEEILEKYKECIRIYSCPSRNLSQSRNIGIINAKGDIVAFIDDDAIAHPMWLERIVGGYVDERVYGVGGFTFDHTGYDYQCRYTICDRLGNALFPNHLDPVDFLSFKGTFYYPSLLGTNCTFRRDILEKVNGFDEVFAYMLDETDVVLKMVNLGGRIKTVDNAFVFHRYAPSHTRNEDRIPKSYYASSVSKAYFCLKHRRDENDYSVTEHLEQYKKDLEFSCRWYIDREKINHRQFLELTQGLYNGLRDGRARGLYAKSCDGNLSEHSDEEDDFKKFTLTFSKRDKLRICLVSQGYPPKDTSGIARWTHELAGELSRLGHEVHVITNSPDQNTVDYENGVWVHRICSIHPDECFLLSPVRVPDSVYFRCHSVYNEVVRTDKIWGIDIVSAPIWDVEGLLCAAHLDKPVITSLHTTYRLALPYKKEWHQNTEYRWRHVEKVIDAERWLLTNSSFLLANSNQIVADIEIGYDISLSEDRYQVVPHGIQDYGASFSNYQKNESLNITYVGRVEERKGTDIFLKAALPLLLENHSIVLNLVGDLVSGEKNFIEKMDRIKIDIEENNLSSRVKFHGYVTEDKLLEFYRNCDIFVCPSRYESFGLIVIEAMRFGKLVVASNVGGIVDIIDHDNNGLLFESENHEQLCGILRNVVSDQEKLRRLSLAARRSYEEDYTLSKMAKSILGVYRHALAKS